MAPREQLGGSASLAAALPQWISNVPGGSVFCGPMAAVVEAQQRLIKRALVRSCGRMFPQRTQRHDDDVGADHLSSPQLVLDMMGWKLRVHLTLASFFS